MSNGVASWGRKGAIAALPAFWTLAGLLFLAGPVQVGFLSDDHELLARASQVPWYHALDDHHWSPILSALFGATSRGVIGRATWVALAWAAHCLNIALLWSILVRRLRFVPLQAVTITALFTIGAAGFEALAWSCAIGYVLVTTVILLGFVLLMAWNGERIWGIAAGLAALQVLAFVVWDWGVLFAPLMALCCMGNRIGTQGLPAILRQGSKLLGPSFACWLLILILKSVWGQSFGYAVSFSLSRMARYLAIAPLLGIYPNGTLAFYKSPWGLSMAAGILLVLSIASVYDRKVRTAAVMFLVCLTPCLALGAPESRYFYLGCPFLYTALVLALSHLPGRRTPQVLAILLVIASGFWSVQRALWWRGASDEAQRVKTEIESRLRDPSDAIVVVNLPDRYGPDDLVWMPYVWRNGTIAIRALMVRVNTPGVPFTWRDASVPVMSREEIARAYAGRQVLEVVYAQPGCWQRFAVIPVRELPTH